MPEQEIKDTEVKETEVKEELVDYTYNGKSIKLAKELVDSINGRVASEKHQIKEKLTTLAEENNNLKTKISEYELSQMTDAQKKELEVKKQKEKEEALLQKASESESKFKNYFLDTELYKAVSDYEVHNSKQVVKLLKSEYKHDFVEDDNGELQIVFNVNGNKVSIKDAFKAFFNDPSNANLLKSTLKSGGGTSIKTGSGSSTQNLRTEYTRAEVQTESGRKEYNAAMKAGLNPIIKEGN